MLRVVILGLHAVRGAGLQSRTDLLAVLRYTYCRGVSRSPSPGLQ